ncbi:MAG: chorismate mutase [Kordiimonadaceae bacterium]|nr:chorismate mutase [Kordiimonadaceae bacterium]
MLKDLKNKLDLDPNQCQDMNELRGQIDHLDREIVELLALRKTFMDRAAELKKHRSLVRDDKRVVDVIKKVSEHASKNGADPKLVADLYRTMIEWSINYEFDQFDKINSEIGESA